MPPVIVAVAASAAYAGVVGWVGATVLGYALGAVAAFGVNAIGRAVFGLNVTAEADPLENPDLLLTNSPSNTAQLPVVYGTRRLGGTVVFAEVYGSENQYLNTVYAIAEGEVESLGAMYLDGERVPEQVGSEWVILEATAPGGVWFNVTVKAVEDFGGVFSFSGTWAQLQTALASYPGTISVTHGASTYDPMTDPPPPGDQYSLTIRPYDGTAWEDQDPPQIRAEVTGSWCTSRDYSQSTDGAGRPVISLRIENRADGYSSVSATVSARLYTAGQRGLFGRVEINRHAGGDDQVADASLVARSEAWTAAHRLAGVAYVYARYSYNQDAFPNGIPTATWDVVGRKVYDPRSGATEWSENPALCVLDYLINTRYGRGAAMEAVDVPAIEAAANYCDQLVEGDTKRWTCNGAVLTGRTALDNMQAILSSCRGWLVHSGGLYRLVLDAPASPVLTFTEETITGAWSFQLGDKRTTANRVAAKIFDPAQDYQTVPAIADSEALRVIDRGLLLEQSISLEFTNTAAEAYRQAAIELNQSRQGLVVQFAAMPIALTATAGDVVRITHSRPGWDAKKFRLLSMKLRQAGDIEITAQEYADEVYDYGTISVEDPAPNTNLPSPLHVEPPGPPVVTEALYSTSAAAGVKVKALVSWPAAPDAYVSEYLVEARGPTDFSWQQVARTGSTGAEVLDAQPGPWSFRVLAINSLGVRSEFSEVAEYTIQGLMAPPATPGGLSLTAHSYLALLSWELHPDLDVRAGGSFRVRHVPAVVVDPTWDDGQDIGPAVAGSATQVVLPLLAGAYFVKAVDSSGVESVTPAMAITDAPGLLNLVQIDTWDPTPDWSGTYTDTEENGGALRLVESGGAVVETVGAWEGSVMLILTEPKSVQLLAELQASAYSVQDQVDSRTDLVDTWDDFDGAVHGAAAAEVWVSNFNMSNSQWGEYQRLTVADFYGQVFKFRVVLRSTGPAFNVAVTGLTVTAQEVSAT